MIQNFDQIKVVLAMIFMSLGCTMVTLRSEKLLYINTSYPHGTSLQADKEFKDSKDIKDPKDLKDPKDFENKDKDKPGDLLCREQLNEYLVQWHPAIPDVKGPINFICYWRIFVIAIIGN